MKLLKGDNVVVITGRDKGKVGKITAVLPAANKVVVEGINVVKRHTKPSNKVPRGGILDITKGIDVSKVMVLDPDTGKPARVGYELNKAGKKERIFKVSPNAVKPKASTKSETKSAAKADDKKVEKKDVEAKAESKETQS